MIPGPWESFMPVARMWLRLYPRGSTKTYASMVYFKDGQWLACGEGMPHAVPAKTRQKAMDIADEARTTGVIMSSFDDGNVPYRGRWCKCGMLAGTSEDDVVPGHCPNCNRPWPAEVVQRSDYDGGPPMFGNPEVEERNRAAARARAAALKAEHERAQNAAAQDDLDRALGRCLRETMASHRLNTTAVEWERLWAAVYTLGVERELRTAMEAAKDQNATAP